MRCNRLFTRFLIGIFLILTMVCGNYGYLLASGPLDHQPLVIIAADKMDSFDLFNCKLPSVKRLLATGACGLMNIRSSAGYTDTASGYLTMGAGSRSAAPEIPGGVFPLSQTLPGGTAQSYLIWTFGADTITKPDRTGVLIVPDIGRVKNE